MDGPLDELFSRLYEITQISMYNNFSISPRSYFHISYSSRRNTGNVEQAARVCADKVPSVCILDSEGNNSMEVRQQTALHKVPTVVREGGIVGM